MCHLILLLQLIFNFKIFITYPVFFTFRCTSIEKQTLPSNWVLNCEIFDDISLYELRVMYWLTLASAKLAYIQQPDLYEKGADSDLLEKIIYFKYYLQNIENLYNKLKSGELLNKHQLLSLYFMKHIVLSKRNDECVTEYFSEKYLNQIDELLKNIDEKIDIPVPDCVICDNHILLQDQIIVVIQTLSNSIYKQVNNRDYI